MKCISKVLNKPLKCSAFMEIYKPLSWLYLSKHLISHVHIPNPF